MFDELKARSLLIRLSTERTVDIAVDTETTGLHVASGDDWCIGVSIAGLFEDGTSFSGYFPFAHETGENFGMETHAMLDYVLSEDPHLLIFCNAQFDILSLSTIGIRLDETDFIDICTMAHLCDENWPKDKKLDTLAKVYLSDGEREEGSDEAKIVDKFVETEKRTGNANITPEQMSEYAVRDAVLTWRVHDALLDHRNWKALLRDAPNIWPHKQELIRVLIEMARRGVRIDQALAAQEIARGESEMKRIARELGYPGVPKKPTKANPEPDQDPLPVLGPIAMEEIFIDRLGLPILKASEKTGKPSFDKTVMEEYDIMLERLDSHEAKLVKAYRGWQITVGLAYRPYLELIDDDGRLRCSYKTHGTVTGRLSCVAGDSLVEMPRDMVKHPNGVPITQVKAGDWVYAFDWQRELVLKRVKWVAQTGIRQTVVVTSENSDGNKLVMRVTPDHLVRLRNGDWRAAGSLIRKWGDASRAKAPVLMPMVRRAFTDDGYIRFFPHSIARGGGMSSGGKNSEHRWVAGQVRGLSVSPKSDIHHADNNKTNNSPNNLVWLSPAEHRGNRDLHPLRGAEATSRPNIYTGPNDYRVVSVEDGPVEPVWDMEIEDVHNFIVNGICVHNCSKPNLQQIPKSSDKEWNGKVKKAFIAKPGYTLVNADFSQLELRLGTAYAGEPELAEVFAEGRDIFTEMSLQLELTRQDTKTLVYSMQYGAGLNRIMTVFGVSKARAEEIRNNYFNTYPRFKTLADRCTRSAEQDGRVRIWSGRYRHFKYKSESFKAMNSVIQGGAADIVERVMVRCFRELDNEDCQMLLQVHDSITFEVRTELVDFYMSKIEALMEDVEGAVGHSDFPVRFAVEVDLWVKEQ